MGVFVLRYPGMQLGDMEPRQGGMEIEGLLFELERDLAGAAVGLSLFEEALLKKGPRSPAEDALRLSRAIQAREAELVTELRLEYATLQGREPARERAELEIRQREWATGRIPFLYSQARLFGTAHMVLYALDGIRNTLDKLRGLPTVPKQAKIACTEFDKRLPDVEALRDSAQHIHERRERKKRRGTIVPEAVNTQKIRAPTGTLMMLGCLNGNRLQYTSADGKLCEIEISAATVETARQVIQGLLNSFQWIGMSKITPC
jgi:hypothetical protein